MKGKAVLNKFKGAFGKIALAHPFLFECHVYYCDGRGIFNIEFMDEILGNFVRAPSKKLKNAMLGVVIERVADMIVLLEKQSFTKDTS
jgi:hypothetical protein